MKIAIGGVVLILAISCIAFLIKGMNGAKPEETESESAVELTTGPEKTVYVEGIDITGMTMDEARSAILDKFGWSMKVTWQDQTYEVADLMEEKVSALLTEIYSGMAEDMDDYGSLLVRNAAGKIESFDFGEISIRSC